MEVMVTGRHVSVTQAMKDYARDKVKKCEKFRPSIQRVHIVMDVEKIRHKVEINASASRHINIHVEDVSDDMYKSIDSCLDKLTQQMRKYKGKVQHHKLKEAEKSKRDKALMGSGELIEEEPQSISIHRQALSRKPMSLEEALLELKALEDDFLVFFNSETQAASVLYRITKNRCGYIKEAVKPNKKEGKLICIVEKYSIKDSKNNGGPNKVGEKEMKLEEVAPEAISTKLKKLKKNHWVFVNSETGLLNVLYRRNDGAIGLIE